MSFLIASDGKSITCLKCGKTSYNENDVRERYCGYCHEFHAMRERIREHFEKIPPGEVVANAKNLQRPCEYGGKAREGL